MLKSVSIGVLGRIGTFGERGLGALGAWVLKALDVSGSVFMFLLSAIKWFFKRPFRWKALVAQLEFVGNQSVFIIILAGVFTGAVFALQTYVGFSMIGAEGLVGSSTALGLTKELGPVLTGLIITGRAGAAMAAQIGSMRVSEQIDALEVMAVSPIQYLVSPRIVAAVFATPLLYCVFVMAGLVGSFYVGVHLCGIDEGAFTERIDLLMDFIDIVEGLIKSAFFGLIFATIGCYKGFKTTGGAQGVGAATNDTVVISTIMILISDYFLSSMIAQYIYLYIKH